MTELYEEASRRAYMAELLNDASIDCVIAMDTGLRITTWNRMCETLSGKPRESVLGKRLADVFPELNVPEALTAALDGALKGLKSFIPVEQGSFSQEYMETHVIPLKDAQEQVIGVLIVRHDVAHRQKAEQELKRLNHVLAQKNRELEQKNAELIAFARITSHDLKEPLRKIHLFSNMFLEQEQGRLSEEAASLFARIQKSAKKAEALTDDIFVFSDIQHVSEPAGTVDLDMIFKMSKHKLHERIQDSGAVIDATAELPAVTGYRTLVQRLFENIMDNALKFSPADAGGPPQIAIRYGAATGAAVVHPDAMPDVIYTWVSFTDNGIGFEQKYEGLVFELFQRLNKSGEYGGNGVGLSLCKKIMELHRGFITVQSTPGQGSTFTCYFPVQEG
jgi:PAS domain S-box-containing protein